MSQTPLDPLLNALGFPRDGDLRGSLRSVLAELPPDLRARVAQQALAKVWLGAAWCPFEQNPYCPSCAALEVMSDEGIGVWLTDAGCVSVDELQEVAA